MTSYSPIRKVMNRVCSGCGVDDPQTKYCATDPPTEQPDSWENWEPPQGHRFLVKVIAYERDEMEPCGCEDGRTKPIPGTMTIDGRLECPRCFSSPVPGMVVKACPGLLVPVPGARYMECNEYDECPYGCNGTGKATERMTRERYKEVMFLLAQAGACNELDYDPNAVDWNAVEKITPREGAFAFAISESQREADNRGDGAK